MDPSAKAKAIVSVVVAIMGLLASGALGFPPGTSDSAQQTIIHWAVWLLSIYSAINGVLHLMPDPPKLPPAK